MENGIELKTTIPLLLPLLPSRFIPISVMNKINQKKEEGHPSNSPKKMSVYKSPLQGHWDSNEPPAKKKKSHNDERENNSASSQLNISGITPLKKKVSKVNRWDQEPMTGKSSLPPKRNVRDQKKNVAKKRVAETAVSNEECSTVTSTTSNVDHLKKFTVKHWMPISSRVDDNVSEKDRSAVQGDASEQLNLASEPTAATAPQPAPSSSTTTSFTERVRKRIMGSRWDKTSPMRRRSGSKNEPKTTIYEKLKNKFSKLKGSDKRTRSPMVGSSVLDKDSTPVGISRKKRKVDGNGTRTPHNRRVAQKPGPVSAERTSNRKRKFMEVQRLKKLKSGKRRLNQKRQSGSRGQLGDSWRKYGSWNKYVESEKLKQNSLNRDVIDLTCGEPAGLAPWATSVTNYMLPQTDLDAERLPRGTGVTVTLSEDGSRSVNPDDNGSGRRVKQAHASNYVSMPCIVLDEEPQWRSAKKRKRISKANASTSIPSILIEDDSNPSTEENADESVRFISLIESSPSKQRDKKRLRRRAQGNVEEIFLIDDSLVILDSPKNVVSPAISVLSSTINNSPPISVLSPLKSESPKNDVSPMKCISPLESVSPHKSASPQQIFEPPQPRVPSPIETRHKSPSPKKVATETCARPSGEADDSLVIVEERLQERTDIDHPSPSPKKVATETCARPSVEADDSLVIVEERLQERTDIDHPSPSESPDIEFICQTTKLFSKSSPSKDQTAVVNRRINSLVKSHTSKFIPLNPNPMPANPTLSNPKLDNQMIENQIVAKRMLGLKMFSNQLRGNQMIDNQLRGNQMLGNQMLGNPMLGNQMLGNPMLGNQMLGNQMLGNQMVQQWQPMASAQQSTSQGYGNNYSTPPRQAKSGLRPIIIDGSNVAMGHGRQGLFSSRGLQICIDFFLKKNHKVYAFVPLYRRSDPDTVESRILDDLEKAKHLIFTPSRYVDGRRITPYDDRYIVQTAAELGGVIVSKDNYRDLLEENPNFADVIKNRLLMFTWVEDMIMFPPDPLGRDGPTLDRFLRF